MVEAASNPSLLSRARELADAARFEVDRVRLSRRVFKKTGVSRNITPRGMVMLLRAALAGQTNPALLFRLHATNIPTKKALVFHDTSWTFAELDDAMDRLALGLAARGMGRRDGALLMMKNRPEMVMVQPAMSRIGGAAVSVSWRSTPSELAYLAENSGARALFFDADVAETVLAARKDLPGLRDDLLISVGGRVPGFPSFEDVLATKRTPMEDASEEGAVVIYTSGTTGKPKGAVRKFKKEVMPAALRFIEATPLREDDVHLATCPMYHSTAFGFIAMSYALGNTVVLMDHFEPNTFLSLVEKHRVTQTAVVPTMLHRILALGPDALARHDTRSLRIVFSGGAPLPGPLAVEFMDAFGDVVWNFYGATETGLVTLASPADLRAAPGTIGPALEGNEIRLLGDDGCEVADGQVGELYVKNALLIEGYHGNDEATRQSMNAGFFSVGDLARRDARGRYHIEGRKRDMVISGGVNVYPAEVESVLEAHPAIAEVAVVGIPDQEWGEKVVAFVSLREGHEVDDQALRAYCREKLAGPKNPRAYVFLPQLPRNPTGKVLKRELRHHLIPTPNA